MSVLTLASHTCSTCLSQGKARWGAKHSPFSRCSGLSGLDLRHVHLHACSHDTNSMATPTQWQDTTCTIILEGAYQLNMFTASPISFADADIEINIYVDMYIYTYFESETILTFTSKNFFWKALTPRGKHNKRDNSCAGISFFQKASQSHCKPFKKIFEKSQGHCPSDEKKLFSKGFYIFATNEQTRGAMCRDFVLPKLL